MMTYAAALDILKAPRFGDPDAIAARDLVLAVDRVVQLIDDYRECPFCAGTGQKQWGFFDTCDHCEGLGVRCQLNLEESEELLALWEFIDEACQDARQEALRRVRTQRKGPGGGNLPAALEKGEEKLDDR